MNTEAIVGTIAGVLTSASLLPQLIKTIKEKDAKSLSVMMILVLIAGNSLWLYYGILKNDFPIIITNIFSDLVNVSLLFASVKYKKRKANWEVKKAEYFACIVNKNFALFRVWMLHKAAFITYFLNRHVRGV